MFYSIQKILGKIEQHTHTQIYINIYMYNETGKHIFLLHYFCTLRVLLKNSNAKRIRVFIGNRQNREPIETRILYTS